MRGQFCNLVRKHHFRGFILDVKKQVSELCDEYVLVWYSFTSAFVVLTTP